PRRRQPPTKTHSAAGSSRRSAAARHREAGADREARRVHHSRAGRPAARETGSGGIAWGNSRLGQNLGTGLLFHVEERLAHFVAVTSARQTGEREHVVSRCEADSRGGEGEAPARLRRNPSQSLTTKNLLAANGLHDNGVREGAALLQIQLESHLFGASRYP